MAPAGSWLLAAEMARYLVTGATRGIGRAVVDALAEHEVIALGRDPVALQQLDVAGRVVADLAQPQTLAAALPDFGHLDAVVHCAGVARRITLAQAQPEEWLRQFTVNVFAVAELTRLVLPALRMGAGRVVLINSGQGRSVAAGSAVYAASKHALHAVAQALQVEEPHLRVTSIYPGRVASQMQRQLRAEEGGEYQPERYIQPETVAGVVANVLACADDAVLTEVVIRPSWT